MPRLDRGRTAYGDELKVQRGAVGRQLRRRNVETRAVVRRASPDDAEALSTLCAEHAAFERLPFSPSGHAARLRALLAATEAPEAPLPLYAWVAELDGEIVGYTTASPTVSTFDGAIYLHMDCLYLRSEYRGGGTGWLLMQQPMACGVAMGCTRMEWQTPRWNEPAARFYVKHGALERIKRRFYLSL